MRSAAVRKEERWCGREVEAELGGHGVDRGERVRVRVELERWRGAAVAKAVVGSEMGRRRGRSLSHRDDGGIFGGGWAEDAVRVGLERGAPSTGSVPSHVRVRCLSFFYYYFIYLA